MNHPHKPVTRFLLYMLLSAILLIMSGCQSTPVEKLYALPDRETQLLTAQQDELPEEFSIWDVTGIQNYSLRTASSDFSPGIHSHFTGDNLYTIEEIPVAYDQVHYQVGELRPDASEPQLLHELDLTSDLNCAFSPDGKAAAYGLWENAHIILIWHDLATDDQRLIWESDDLSRLLDFGIEISWTLCFTPDGECLLFVPFMQLPTTDKEAAAQLSTAIKEDASNEYTNLFDIMQYNISYARVYDSTTEALTAYYISPEIYSVYLYGSTGPSLAASDDFFVILHAPGHQAPYCTVISFQDNNHWTEILYDYVSDMAGVYTPSSPAFHDGLLYIVFDGSGIAAIDLKLDQQVAFYTFNDPIYSFTVYDNTLIVAQPAASGGTDVTAYLLSEEERTQSILLYHQAVSDPYLYHLEMTSRSDGSRVMLMEQLEYEDSGIYKKLILLNF